MNIRVEKVVIILVNIDNLNAGYLLSKGKKGKKKGGGGGIELTLA